MIAVKKLYLHNTSLVIWYAALLWFSYLMLLITLQYVPMRTDVAFLLIKEDVVGMLHYRIAFFAHVYTGMFVLIAGILQFPAYIRNRFPALHRWCGRVYAYLIIIVTGPAGLIMGIYGNGGWVSRSAFCILAVLWVVFTYKGVAAAVARNIITHRIWMYRSYALTLSAISLRFWKWLFVLMVEPRPMDVYHIVSWLGWVGNLLIAELYIYYTTRKRKASISGLSLTKS
ncbi:DUF2306 domain-containing protein [Mucilaginibacter sp. AW1-3]